MADAKIQNAIITSTHLGREDHNIPTCMLTLDYGGSGQGFGGYDLRFYGFEMIDRIISTIGAKSWEDLRGKHCRAKATYSKVLAIGHIIEDRWYEPEVDGRKAEDADAA